MTHPLSLPSENPAFSPQNTLTIGSGDKTSSQFHNTSSPGHHSTGTSPTEASLALSDNPFAALMAMATPGPFGPMFPEQALAALSVGALIRAWEVHDLPSYQECASYTAMCSRVKRLDQVFGHLTLGGLVEPEVEKLMRQRQMGKFGTGHIDRRRSQDNPGKMPTKDQRRHARRRSKPLPLSLQPVSQQTIRHELRLLRQILVSTFKRFFRSQLSWIQAHPLMNVKLPKPSAPRFQRVTAEALTAILEQLRGRPTIRDAVMFAVANSHRRNEIVRLNWDDVDLEKRCIRLKPNPKQRASKTEDRFVPLTPLALSILHKRLPPPSLRFGRVFPLDPGTLTQAFRRAADRAGYPNVRLHDLRREAISTLVEAELPIAHVAAFSGHRDIATLQKHYVRLDPTKVSVSVEERVGKAQAGLRHVHPSYASLVAKGGMK